MLNRKLIAILVSGALVVASVAYAGTVARGEIHGKAGVCLDVRGGGTAQFTPVQIWSCVGNENQLLTFTDVGEIRDSKNMCLDIQGGITTNGTPVEMHSCNATAAQKWTRTPAGEIRGKDGKCLDLRAGNTTNGSLVQVWDCVGKGAPNGANQQWTLSPR